MHVDVCADRECAHVEQQADVMGESHRFTEPFGIGPHFWRLRARRGATLAAGYGPTWVFTVTARDLAIDTAWPIIEDGDGDGSVGPAPSLRGNTVVDGDPRCPFGRRSTAAARAVFAGDRNGDGFGDYVGQGFYSWMSLMGPGHAEQSFPFEAFGSRSGVGPDFVEGERGPFSDRWDTVAIGDFNGDGHADLATQSGSADASYDVVRLPGVTTSVAAPPNGRVLPLGDVNGDALMDVLIDVDCGNSALPGDQPPLVYLGSRSASPVSFSLPTCPGAPEGWFTPCPAASDVNNDGLTDIVVGRVIYFGNPAGISAERCEVRPAP